jgi:hypothetical protein
MYTCRRAQDRTGLEGFMTVYKVRVEDAVLYDVDEWYMYITMSMIAMIFECYKVCTRR